MKFIFISLVFSLSFSACSTLNKVEFITPQSKEVFTTKISDEVEISFNEGGKFISFKITISEKVLIDLPGAKERASSRALNKAKDTLSNYIDNSDKEKYFELILQTLVVVKKVENQNIPKILSNDIKNKKDYILESLYLDRATYFRENQVVNIIARSSNKFEKVSNKLKKIFE